MDTSFDLIKDASDLKNTSMKVGKTSVRRIGPNRDVADSDAQEKFSQGDIEYRWSLSNQTYQSLKDSYVAIDVELTKANGDLLEDADDIAFARGTSSCLFESAVLYLNDVEISRCEYHPEVSAFYYRSKRSGYWLDNKGQGSDNWSADFEIRKAISLETKQTELTYQPPMQFWHNDIYSVAGRYRLVITPSNQYKTRAVESLATKVAGADYRFRVKSAHLYLSTVNGPPINDDSYLIDYSEIAMQPQTLSSAEFHSKTFTVPQSTFSIGLAHQDILVGNDTRVPPTLYQALGNKQNNVSSLLIQYSNMSYPESGSVNMSSVNDVDKRGKVYQDTMLTNMNSECESKQNWDDGGMYVNARFIKDATDLSNIVRIDETIVDGAENIRLLCFSEYSKVAQLTIQNGVVVNVEVSNS